MNQIMDPSCIQPHLKSVSWGCFLSHVEPWSSKKSLRQSFNEVRRLNSTAECQGSVSWSRFYHLKPGIFYNIQGLGNLGHLVLIDKNNFRLKSVLTGKKHAIKENCFDLDLRWNVKMEILKSGLYKQFTPNMSGSIPGPWLILLFIQIHKYRGQ